MAQIIKCDTSVVKALAAINDSDLLTVFVVDEKNVLVGTLTDGDVRRYLINGGQLNDPVVNAVKKSFLKIEKNDSDALKSLKEFKAKGIKLVPVLNSKGEIEDVYDLVNYKSHLPIDAVLMAGGKGERLRPLTEKTPKPLLPVGDKCIIDHNVDRLISYGVKHISVTVNYLKELIEEHYSTPRHGIKVNTCREPKYLGTIGSIKFVEQFYNDTILIMNSDLFTNIDYEDFYLHFKENNAQMSVVAVPYTVNVPYGIFELNGRDIIGVKEKPVYNYYANAGIYLIKKDMIDLIPKNEFFNATDLIEVITKKGGLVVRYPHSGYWIDVGQQADLAKAQELAKHSVL